MERSATLGVIIPAIVLIGAGTLLIAGLWTPIAGSIIALTEIWKILTLPGDKSLWVVLGTAGAALAMLGPGAWSVDARLYGWKRLEATPRKRSDTFVNKCYGPCQCLPIGGQKHYLALDATTEFLRPATT